jgi:hypothetical protein
MRLEFDARVIVVRYETEIGTAHRHRVNATIRRTRRSGVRRAGSGRRTTFLRGMVWACEDIEG